MRLLCNTVRSEVAALPSGRNEKGDSYDDDERKIVLQKAKSAAEAFFNVYRRCAPCATEEKR